MQILMKFRHLFKRPILKPKIEILFTSFLKTFESFDNQQISNKKHQNFPTMTNLGNNSSLSILIQFNFSRKKFLGQFFKI